MIISEPIKRQKLFSLEKNKLSTKRVKDITNKLENGNIKKAIKINLPVNLQLFQNKKFLKNYLLPEANIVSHDDTH